MAHEAHRAVGVVPDIDQTEAQAVQQGDEGPVRLFRNGGGPHPVADQLQKAGGLFGGADPFHGHAALGGREDVESAGGVATPDPAHVEPRALRLGDGLRQAHAGLAQGDGGPVADQRHHVAPVASRDAEIGGVVHG